MEIEVYCQGKRIKDVHGDGLLLLMCIQQRYGLHNIRIKNANFEKIAVCERLIENVVFDNCVIIDVDLKYVGETRDVIFKGCRITGDIAALERDGVYMLDCKINELPTNEEIQKIVGGKVFSLPNKDFVKVCVECDFCHNTFYDIMSRKRVKKMLRPVPQSDKRVCDQCYQNYQLETKAMGCRTYGWHGPLSFYKTPMDAKDTEILGLEMEFEGEFFDWKGLQDAHRGHLHYGYDSSVAGQNELSWDCGSYSYWKYLAPLEDTCKAVENGGGKPGPTAGIHIHVSSPGSDVRLITHQINGLCSSGVFKTLMKSVSLRDDKVLFDRYANLNSSEDEHHAGISYNGHGTCEFRVFNSTLNPKIILRHLKFCKEFYHLVKMKTPSDIILESFSKETKKHIITCAKVQLEKGFVAKTSVDTLIKKLGAL